MRAGCIFIAVSFLAASTSLATEPTSKTVIGPANLDLAAGADALRFGDYEEGIKLTLRGLEQHPSERDRSAALSNLCAGYAATDQYDLAIKHCSDSLEINERNWHAYHNRAAAHLYQGNYDEAIEDAQAGLALNPRSRKLRRALEVAEEKKRELYTPRVVIEEH